MAFVYVKNKDDALDVIQEVAYHSFKKIDTLKSPEYFKTWLIKITIHCALDTLRKNKKVIQLNKDYDQFVVPDTEDIPLTLSLQQLLAELTEDEKSIVLLKYYQGYSFKEIAEMLNIPLGTAKSILYRSLDKLRKHAKGADFFE